MSSASKKTDQPSVMPPMLELKLMPSAIVEKLGKALVVEPLDKSTDHLTLGLDGSSRVDSVGK